MARDRRKLQHIHSSIADRQPTPATLAVGEIAVNNADKKEFLSIKSSNDNVVRFSSDEQMITWMERKEVMPYKGYVKGRTANSTYGEDPGTGDTYNSYGITNDDLLENKSQIIIKLNQVAAKKTGKYDKVNNAKDKYGNTINPWSGETIGDGAGFYIDMSRYAMNGANPIFSSLTVTDKTDLSGNTTITDGDGTGTRTGKTFTVNVTNENETVTTLNESATTRTTLIGTENLTVSGTTTEVKTGAVTETNSSTTNITRHGVVTEDNKNNVVRTTSGTTTETFKGQVTENNQSGYTINTTGNVIENTTGTTTIDRHNNVSENNRSNVTVVTSGNSDVTISGTSKVKVSGSTTADTSGNVTVTTSGTTTETKKGNVTETNLANIVVNTSGTTTYNNSGTTTTNESANTVFNTTGTTTFTTTGNTIITTNGANNKVTIQSTGSGGDVTIYAKDDLCATSDDVAAFKGANTTNIGSDCSNANQTSTLNVRANTADTRVSSAYTSATTATTVIGTLNESATTATLSGNTLAITEATSTTLKSPTTTISGTSLNITETNTTVSTCGKFEVTSDNFSVKQCSTSGGSVAFEFCNGFGVKSNAVTFEQCGTNGTFTVKEKTTNISGTTTNISGATNITGATNIKGATTISGSSLSVTGATNLNGNVCVTGTVTASQAIYSSDRNLKENIEDVPYDLAKLANDVKVKSFNFIGEQDRIYGVIAQEVQEAGLGEIVYTKDDGHLAVDYTSLSMLKIAYLENLCGELLQRIKQLQDEIKVLKFKNQ